MPFFTSNGVNLFVDRIGAGPPLLFLHELTLDHRQWDEQGDVLRAQHQVIRLDMRGHGRSARTATGHTYTAFAADVHRALVQVGIAPLNRGFLVAQGIAADAALQAALAEPRALKGIVLLSPCLWGHDRSDAWLRSVRALQRSVRAGEFDTAIEEYRRDVLLHGVHSVVVAERVRELQRSFSGDYFRSDEADSGTPTLERISACKLPILVVQASRDDAGFHAVGARIAETAPQAHVVELDAGHVVNLEAPDGFNRLLRTFINENA